MNRFLDERVSVSGQVAPGQVADLAADGVTVLICNRPDHEEPGQPTLAEMAGAAEAVGIRFVARPFQGRPGPDAVEVMAEILGSGERAHAFCRSGMRSAATWALAEVQRGRPVDEVLAAGRAAGYDLAGLFT
ncbi:TIGR01244 family sulfur transferase [Brevundimonas aveniformis]|uniref:TIGR01244 family sulfur transferase n=1 Tax=Brevundimonas aveniformis TaxID=370977 RepID=UPI0024909AAD|nr:TIGR01244 family sulfur transferase [Brevundimonas aveniformis]